MMRGKSRSYRCRMAKGVRGGRRKVAYSGLEWVDNGIDYNGDHWWFAYMNEYEACICLPDGFDGSEWDAYQWQVFDNEAGGAIEGPYGEPSLEQAMDACEAVIGEYVEHNASHRFASGVWGHSSLSSWYEIDGGLMLLIDVSCDGKWAYAVYAPDRDSDDDSWPFPLNQPNYIIEMDSSYGYDSKEEAISAFVLHSAYSSSMTPAVMASRKRLAHENSAVRSLRRHSRKKLSYEYKTTFWEDFSIADMFGPSAVQDTYNRAFREWRDDCEYVTELCMVLNHKCWAWYEKNDELSRLYEELYYQLDGWCFDHLKGDDLSYYIRTMD